MKKTYKVEGMMCKNCRRHVEEALNSMDGVKAVVTLDPPLAEIEFVDKLFEDYQPITLEIWRSFTDTNMTDLFSKITAK